jgi:PAS domain-containing protein
MFVRFIAVVVLSLWGVMSHGQQLSRAQSNITIFRDIRTFLTQAKTTAVEVAQLRGAVSYSFRQSSFYMQDATGGLFVSSATNIPLQIGDLVEAQGKSYQDGFSPILKESALRKIGPGTLPEPKNTTAVEIIGGKHDMEFVRLPATVLDVGRRTDRTVLLRLLDRNISFSAELDRYENPPAWKGVLPQARVQLTGVCTIGGDRNGLIRNFRILLRDESDLLVTRPPPWWTFERTLRVVIILGVLILGGLIWVAALNHQVRQQTRELRARFEREAELEDQYHDLFENAQELVFMLDAEGRFVSMNKATEQTLGCQRFEALVRALSSTSFRSSANGSQSF